MMGNAHELITVMPELDHRMPYCTPKAWTHPLLACSKGNDATKISVSRARRSNGWKNQLVSELDSFSHHDTVVQDHM